MTVTYYGPLFSPDQDLTPEIRKAAQETIAWGIALLRQNSPVKTGALKAGWNAKMVGNGIEWGNSVPYTVYNELGTVRMAPKAMLADSMPAINEYFKDRLNRALAMKNAGAVLSGKAPQTPAAPPKFSAPSYAKLTQGNTVRGFRP